MVNCLCQFLVHEDENGNYFENIQNLNFTYIFTWVKNWTLTASETKNGSGRNEIIETSGRLQPL